MQYRYMTIIMSGKMFRVMMQLRGLGLLCAKRRF